MNNNQTTQAEYPAIEAVKRIPISDAKTYALKNGQVQVLILSRGSDGTDHCVTWGKSVEQCAEAAEMGNRLKAMLKWPQRCQQEPSRVKNLQARLKQADLLVDAAKEALKIIDNGCTTNATQSNKQRIAQALKQALANYQANKEQTNE
jgi:hypothetical protein